MMSKGIGSGKERRRAKPSKGWRFGILCGACCATLVLLINIILTAISAGKYDGEDGKRILYEGSCSTVRNLNVGIHVVINLLSTALLGASNYCMQCLSAPTRKELDKAHAENRSMDIGIPTLRNFKYISWKRKLPWLLLAVTSIPLHLFYNSAVYSSIFSPTYDVWTANPAFFNLSVPVTRYYDRTMIAKAVRIQEKRMDLNSLLKLSPAACLEAYAQQFQTSYTDLIIVTKNTEPDERYPFKWAEMVIPEVTEGDDQYRWICGQLRLERYDLCSSHVGVFQQNISSWKPFDKEVDHCLTQKVTERCKLQMNLSISVIVIMFNVVKSVLMWTVIWAVIDTPIITIGDAISSFISAPDPYTRNQCLRTKERDGKEYTALPQNYEGIVHRWKAIPSRRRWIFCFALLLVALLTVSALLSYGLVAVRQAGYGASTSYVFRLGLGAVDPRTIVRWTLPSTGSSGFLSNVIVANIPQLIFSFIYFAFNALFSLMLMGNEWSQYAVQRKGLRVSAPEHGEQRSTYFLQLPYRFGIPLMLLSGVLHWLISQSLFLIAVETERLQYIYSLRIFNQTSFSCGFSPLAMIIVIVVSAVALVAAYFVGSKRLKSAMPIAGSSSLAISAACQPAEQWVDPAAGLQWGVMYETEIHGHCGFSDQPVWTPEAGKLYA